MQALIGTLADLADGLYVRTDLDPRTSSRTVDVIADLTRLPFADESYGTVICYHVLEHIPDDRAAITELGRVLGDRGIAIIQVPWRPDAATDEDPAASIEQRVLRFGQADHVRLYGTDFETRLAEAGLETTRITPRDFLDEWALRKLCLVPKEPVWIAARSIDGTTVSRQCVSLMKERLISAVFESWMQASVRLELDSATSSRRAEEAQAAAEQARASREAALAAAQKAKEETAAANWDLERVLEEAKASAEEAARWESNYQWLRSRMPVKIMAAVARAGRAVIRSVRSESR